MAEFSIARVFVMEDQENFARISGDYNPIHMDPSAARHTQAGAPVVHGMHLLLWALENLLGDGMDLARLSWGKVKFTSFVLLGKAAILKIIERNEKEIRVAVRCGDATAMIVRLGLGGDPVQRTAFPAGKMKIPLEPEDPELADLKGRTGNLVANSGTELLCETMFPEASRTLSTGAVRDFALMSTLIGMLIPGLNSILSEISFRVMEEELSDPTLIFAVSQVDERFRMVTFKAEGARIAARLVAF